MGAIYIRLDAAWFMQRDGKADIIAGGNTPHCSVGCARSHKILLPHASSGLALRQGYECETGTYISLASPDAKKSLELYRTDHAHGIITQTFLPPLPSLRRGQYNFPAASIVFQITAYTGRTDTHITRRRYDALKTSSLRIPNWNSTIVRCSQILRSTLQHFVWTYNATYFIMALQSG
jgi:hypothetical protein